MDAFNSMLLAIDLPVIIAAIAALYVLAISFPLMRAGANKVAQLLGWVGRK